MPEKGYKHWLVIDLGFNGGKLAVCNGSGEPETIVFPSGAAPADRATVDPGSNGDDPIFIGDVPWITAIEPQHGAVIVMDEDYCFSDTYLALFRHAIRCAYTGPEMGVVVAVPSGLFVREAFREKLKKWLQGDHPIGAAKHKISEIHVANQPVGAAYLLVKKVGLANMRAQRIGIVDIGMRTTDWVVISDGRPEQHQSISSNIAMAKVYDLAAQRLRDGAGQGVFGPNAIQLEACTRFGQERFTMRSTEFLVKDAISDAATELAPDLVQVIKNHEGSISDIGDLTMVGGGGEIFQPGFVRALPGMTIEVMSGDDAITANARGLVEIYRGRAKKQARTKG